MLKEQDASILMMLLPSSPAEAVSCYLATRLGVDTTSSPLPSAQMVMILPQSPLP